MYGDLVQQVWIGKKSGFGSGVPWRYNDRNPFGLTAVKYPPLLSMNVHRFQMRLHPSDRPLHTPFLLNQGTHIKVSRSVHGPTASAVNGASLTRTNCSYTPRTPQSPTGRKRIIIVTDGGADS